MEGITCSTLDDLGVENPRDLYHTDEQKAWEHISQGWEIFQRHVAYMLLPKEPSDQHIILAELFHDGHVTHIISFNWDNLIEKAYRKLYTIDITKVAKEGIESDHALWKLHGDINNTEERWVLPFEEGKVFKELQQIVSQTAVHTISIGYREQEQVVHEKLFSVLEKRGGITRIRPDLDNNPPESFADNAISAMKRIKAGLESAKKSAYPA
ncbi:SIR2 family protein [Chloroflexota bacterium]